MKFFSKRPRPIPEGFTPDSIRLETSTCTGERTIGFFDPSRPSETPLRRAGPPGGGHRRLLRQVRPVPPEMSPLIFPWEPDSSSRPALAYPWNKRLLGAMQGGTGKTAFGSLWGVSGGTPGHGTEHRRRLLGEQKHGAQGFDHPSTRWKTPSSGGR